MEPVRNAIKYMPVGVAPLFEYLGVLLVVGWLWAARGQRPRWLTVADVVTVIALLIDMPGTSQLRLTGIIWGLLGGRQPRGLLPALCCRR